MAVLREARCSTDGEPGGNGRGFAGHLLSSEEWRDVVGFEGLYQVSSEGRVRSLRFSPPRILWQGLDNNGYPYVGLWRTPKRHTRKVHRLVCIAFHGPGTILHNEVAHLDGNCANPRADNLKWVSKRENMSHKAIHGTLGTGERHPRARFTNEQVVAIKQELLAGRGQTEIARERGVTVSAIRDMATGKNWRSVGFRGKIRAVRHRMCGGHGGSQAGALNHQARVTAEQAAEIRRRAKAGEHVPTLGRKYGMSRAAVYKLVRGDTYPIWPSEAA